MNEIPDFLNKLLIEQYGQNITNQIIEGYSCIRKSTFRVNTLKADLDEIKQILEMKNIEYKQVEWYKEAIIIEKDMEEYVKKLDIYNNGKIYFQSLSSMIPPLILQPKENEDILDMAAAPGGKTTQISSLTKGKSLITAVEKNKIRADRLRYNIEKLKAPRINVLVQDARRLDNVFSFDRILLDAPCSGSGIFDLYNKNQNITEQLTKRCTKIQLELLKKAEKILKHGHEMVYSTCSILKCENEEKIQKILDRGNLEIVPIEGERIKYIPKLPASIKGTICVKPNELYEGFFIAKLRKK